MSLLNAGRLGKVVIRRSNLSCVQRGDRTGRQARGADSPMLVEVPRCLSGVRQLIPII